MTGVSEGEIYPGLLFDFTKSLSRLRNTRIALLGMERTLFQNCHLICQRTSGRFEMFLNCSPEFFRYLFS